MKTQLLPAIGWPVMPVMRTESGEWVQDTADIIDTVEAAHFNPPVLPDGPLQRFVSQLLHLYGDEWLILPAMHYRWNHNEAWTLAEFGKVAAPDADPTTQLEIGSKRAKQFRGVVPLLGITPDTIPAIEASYLAFLDEFSAHLNAHPYLFGTRPSLADFAFYGPLYAHLYRDPASGEIMKARAPNVARWVERLREGDAGQGELISNDAIPDTLLPLLTRHLREHLSVLQATAAALTAWAADQSPGTELPRAFGMCPFTVEGKPGQTLMRSFSLLRLQTALDAYEGLSVDDRARAEALLTSIDASALTDLHAMPRLTRQNYRLVLAA